VNKSELWEVIKRVEKMYNDDLISEMALYKFSHSYNKTKLEFFFHLFDNITKKIVEDKEEK